MYSVHAALTIDWCLQRNVQPPVYYKTLLGCCASEQIADEADRLVKTAQQEAGNVIVKIICKTARKHILQLWQNIAR